MTLLGFLLLLGGCTAQLFIEMEGKRADPCNGALAPGLRPDCTPGTLAPRADNTILIPSDGSPETTLPPTAAIRGETFPLTMVGLEFPRSVSAAMPTTSLLRLSQAGMESCAPAAIDLSATLRGVQARTNVNGTNMLFNPPQPWTAIALELEDRPRFLCWSPDATNTGNTNFRWTGFRWGVVWNCDNTTSSQQQQCSQIPVSGVGYAGLTEQQQLIRRGRTMCCRSEGFLGIHRNPLVLAPTNLRVGQCVNPSLQSCCGGTAVDRYNEVCCNRTKETVAFVDGFCPCQAFSASTDCPTTAAACCLPTKFTALTPGTQSMGQCYNPALFRCCNTGQRYDPGSQQCCPINGLQSLNLPCPCGVDTDCQLATVDSQTANFICCRQGAPAPIELQQCNALNNFPSGNGPAFAQRCQGACIDPRYQICCNGAACRRSFERCCNSTCCNEFTGTCTSGRRPGTVLSTSDPNTPLPLNAANNVNENFEFTVCTRVEALSPIKSFWIFVLPAALLLASLGGMALALVFANKATSRRFDGLERALVAIAVLGILVSLPLFFSPAYKYGVFVVGAMLVAILTAAARIRWLNVVALGFLLWTLFYLFDPFLGNCWLQLTSFRVPATNQPDPATSGVFATVGKMWMSVQATFGERFCARYYDYFQSDPLLRDEPRFDNPLNSTFGYCSREWVTALLFFAAFAALFTLLAFILALLGLGTRFRADRLYEPVELEVKAQPGYGSGYSGYDGSSVYSYGY